jgi:hypothetical protein
LATRLGPDSAQRPCRPSGQIETSYNRLDTVTLRDHTSNRRRRYRKVARFNPTLGEKLKGPIACVRRRRSHAHSKHSPRSVSGVRQRHHSRLDRASSNSSRAGATHISMCGLWASENHFTATAGRFAAGCVVRAESAEFGLGCPCGTPSLSYKPEKLIAVTAASNAVNLVRCASKG